MSGKARPCRHCGRPVVMRMTRGGRVWPFDNELIAAGSEFAEQLRYVPTPQNVMVPVADVNPRRLEGLLWHAVRHVCADGLRARQAAREARADRAAAVDWSGEVATALHEGDVAPPVEPAISPPPGAVSGRSRVPEPVEPESEENVPGLWADESGWPIPDGPPVRRRNADPQGGTGGKASNRKGAQPRRRTGQ